jgi:alkanesulfonate monooxygenase SsuD/methylene tetrahydromethanopterin reductase-like flavin-dependent oxidoreductase (luciferase family)
MRFGTFQVCGGDSGVESTASRGWPMLNSILTGPVDQILKRRDSYVEALRRHGRGETEIAGLMKNWGVSRQIYVAPTDAQALAEAKDAEMWYQDSLPQDKIRRSMELFAREVMPRFRA